MIRARLLAYLGSFLGVLALASVSSYLFQGGKEPGAALLFDYQSDVPTAVQVFFDVGSGIREEDSTRRPVHAQKSWKEVRLWLPSARISHLRLDPAETEGQFGFRNVRVVDAAGAVRLPIPLDRIHPVQQILSMHEKGGALEIRTVPKANDPILEIALDRPIDLRPRAFSLRLALTLAGWFLFWTAVVALLRVAPGVLARNGRLTAFHSRPMAAIWSAALAGTLLAMAPVVFQGKSLLSPNNGTLLFYDRFPTLPNDSDAIPDDVHGADLGAMEWQHYPLTVVQERALKDFGEFPLWNRYNFAGASMLGQGQLMLGDPINWAMWLFGVDALTFDLKFVLLRAIFAGACGLAVFSITRARVPAVMVAAAAPFITYFIYRVNHPAIFTLCYAPLITLAWLRLIYAESSESRLKWISFLIAANWLVLNSGTVKEAYVAIGVLNSIGATHFGLESSRLGVQFRPTALLLAAAGLSFALIAAPVWCSLLDSIRNGFSVYHEPNVQQLPFWDFLGFVDNFFYLLRINSYFPAVNGPIFVACAVALLGLSRIGALQAVRASVALACGVAFCVAIAFGLIPKTILLAIPFVNNIVHVHNTFSTVLIVPTVVLAGLGFHFLDSSEPNRARAFVMAATALSVLIFLFVLSFAADGGLQRRPFLIYAAGVLPASFAAVWLVPRLVRAQLSLPMVCLCVIATVVAVGRGAMYEDSANTYLFQPHERVDLNRLPPIVERLRRVLDVTPTRVVGVGDVLEPSYNAVLGLENLCGADALMNRRYRDLTIALKLPYTDWGWRIYFHPNQISTSRKALDFLGAGVVLSSAQLATGDDLQYEDDDGEVYAYARHKVWPRAFFSDRVFSYDNVGNLAEIISTDEGPPFVAIERQRVAEDPILQRLVDHQAGTHSSFAEAKDYWLTNETTSFSVDAPGAGVIYLGEADQPGDFVATLNGRRVPYLSANHAFKGIVIAEAGHYRITFRYWPAHLTTYLWLAATGLLLWCSVLGFAWTSRRQGRTRNEAISSGRGPDRTGC